MTSTAARARILNPFERSSEIAFGLAGLKAVPVNP
jgi:hypothetical protein